MRTGRTLTVFRGRTPPENLEVKKFGGTPPKKRHTPPKIWRYPPKKAPPKRHPPKIWRIGGTPPKIWRYPPRGQTHACENITLAKTSFRPVMTGVQVLGILVLSAKQNSDHIVFIRKLQFEHLTKGRDGFTMDHGSRI